MFELVWASFVNVVAPVLGTVVGALVIFLLVRLMKKWGIQVSQAQLDALGTAAMQATAAVEAWAAKKAADSGAKPESKEKAEKAVAMVKTFLADKKLYNFTEDQIVNALEAKLGEDAQHLDMIVETIRNRKDEDKPDSGN